MGDGTEPNGVDFEYRLMSSALETAKALLDEMDANEIAELRATLRKKIKEWEMHR